MKKWIGAAIVTTGLSFGALSFAGLAFGSPAAMGSPAAPASTAKVQTGASQTANSPEATDLSARRRYRHHYRHVYRPYYRPYYYARDRKSTRLNSSHLVISYAVFCLKKKKK